MSTPVSGELTDLCREDPVIRQLLRIMRDGAGMDLDPAVRELSELVPPETVEAAAVRVRELMHDVQTATRPRAVVAGGIESWYPGPREEDPNWSSLLGILRAEGWESRPLEDLDGSSTKVVAHLPNPHLTRPFESKGLVLGYIQSGKTTNFTAVIAKAADAGYRMFIVLSGIHRALRLQTENRLTEQLSDPQSHAWHPLTTDHGFSDNMSVDALAAPGSHRSLGVVLKNPYWLRRVKRWLEGARPEQLTECPVLIIDDEADQASVSTSKPGREPTRINGLIRETLAVLPKVAYVGYTATPFANVLIDPTEAADLYPRDFIVDLPPPETYIGPEAIFGREPLEFDPEGIVEDTGDGHDFIRTIQVDELEHLRPRGSATRHEFEPEPTPSLDDALRYFLLSTAARRIRGAGNPHATALVHTSQHVDVHRRTADVIEGHMRQLAARMGRREPGLFDSLRSMWEDESARVPAADWGLETVAWDDISRLLPIVSQEARVVVDNSASAERLQFDSSDPRVLIAVGGNTLSRGLTLEGLSVSFFVRTASAYDTLLQMGRWFGYRTGYADLTRIWMTDEMREWFHHLATVEQEIRYDIARFESEHLTPLELGVRIRTHPQLAITAAAKMRSAQLAEASYSGRRIQTILFNHRDRAWLERNLRAGRALIGSVRDAPRREIRPGITVLGPVPSSHIEEFVSAYAFHENSRDLDGQLIARYIENRRSDGELTHFHVALMGHGRPSPSLGSVDLDLGEELRCINRARLKKIGGSTYADIKTLMSSSDRVVDLGLAPSDLQSMQMDEVARARNLPSQDGRGDGTGLLLLYPISKDSVPVRGSELTREPLEAVEHMLGVGFVFPITSSRSAAVDYVTADLGSMQIEIPDEADLGEDPEELEG